MNLPPRPVRPASRLAPVLAHKRRGPAEGDKLIAGGGIAARLDQDNEIDLGVGKEIRAELGRKPRRAAARGADPADPGQRVVAFGQNAVARDLLVVDQKDVGGTIQVLA